MQQSKVLGVTHNSARAHTKRRHGDRGFRRALLVVGASLAAVACVAPAAASAASWSVKELPKPAGAKAAGLSGVSCSSSTACTGVGHYLEATGGEALLAERWNGAVWTIQSTAGVAGGTSNLQGVSCTSSTWCVTVGVNQSRAWLLRWNGTSWIEPIQSRLTGGLSGIACTSSTACVAVGHTVSAGTEVTLAEVWNGTAWKSQTTPNPEGAKATSLSGVSCTSTEACTAVGHYVNATGSEVVLAERWNGKTWTIQPISWETGFSNLQGVACTGAESCMVAGFVKGVAWTSHWNGKEWEHKGPEPGGALSGVACTSGEACTAVGHTAKAGPELTLAMRWNGVNWTIQETPNPEGAKSAGLSGVSCTASEACMAVGSFLNASGELLPLAERYH